MPLLWSSLVLGAAGSLHCFGMCGPLVMAASGIVRQHPNRTILSLLHQLGRVTTYTILGLTAGSLGRTFILVGWQQPLTIILGALVIASVLLPKLNRLWTPAQTGLGKVSLRFSRILRQRSLAPHFGLGMAHGLLPCGLVYVALAAAATTGHPLLGAGFMALFGLGTVPVLILTSTLTQELSLNRLLRNRFLVPALACLTGSLLILRGLGLGIPLISPEFSPRGHSACCQPNVAIESPSSAGKP